MNQNSIQHIALVTDGITPFVIGGMQKHSYNLCQHLLLRGIKVTLFHCSAIGHAAVPAKEIEASFQVPNANLKVLSAAFPTPRSKIPGHYLRSSYEYSRWCYEQLLELEEHVDLIYAKGFTSWHFAKMKRSGALKTPLAVKFHGYEMFQPSADFKRSLEAALLRPPVKFIHRQTDFVMSYGGKITKLIREKLKFPQSNILEIPTGIDKSWIASKRTTPKTDEAIHFVFVGRYERRKGIVELHEVLTELPGTTAFQFTFIGPIPEEKQVKCPEVHYVGTIKDATEMQHLLDKAHVLVTPSHSEGMPNVIMEGMARGLAVIGTDTGAVSAVVGSDNGWLLAPGSKAELKSTLHEVLSLSIEELTILGERSRQKCLNHFEWTKIAEETITILNRKVGDYGS